MAFFRKLDSGWELRISYKDFDGKYKEKSKRGFKTKKAAELEASRLEILLNTNSAESLKEINLYDYFVKWVELYKKNKISEVTLVKYFYTAQMIKKYFDGELPISKITTTEYQKCITEFEKTHSFETTKMLQGHIRQCIKVAMHDGVIQKDFTIFSKLKKDKVDNTSKYLELDEYNELLSKAATIEHNTYLLIYLLAVTGLRFSESMGLTWKDIDYQSKTLNIDKTFKNYGVARGFKPTKNEFSARTVPINDTLLVLLSEYKKSNQSKCERIFDYVSNKDINKTLKLIVGRDVHAHSLRHTYVSYLISKDVDLFTISKIVGHRDLQTTLKTYAHLLKDTQQKNFSKVRNLF